jgi:indolepyruvate decarboxylase
LSEQAVNGVMGAKAERSPIFHVVGMPSYQHQRLHKIARHTLGDGVFGNFVDLSAAAACCHAVINPENCVVEMERIIAEARRNNQPAYIAVPSDYAQSPIYKGKPQGFAPVNGSPSDKITMAALYPYSTIVATSSSVRLRKIRTGLTTTSRLGTMPNCRRR